MELLKFIGYYAIARTIFDVLKAIIMLAWDDTEQI